MSHIVKGVESELSIFLPGNISTAMRFEIVSVHTICYQVFLFSLYDYRLRPQLKHLIAVFCNELKCASKYFKKISFENVKTKS